jgi:hypothetical protein
MTNPEGKRGDVPYLKTPVFNITSSPLSQFGPADDSNTYILIRVDLCDYLVDQAYNGQTTDVQLGNGFSGFSSSGVVTTVGDVIVSTTPSILFRYFLMPTNL